MNVCRFLLAVVFIFSGFVKAVDPLGSFYKIQDYLTAFGMAAWFPTYLQLLFAIVLSALEFSVGVFLFFGIRRRFATTLALLLMIVMTPLTLYLALANPVSDCGCFGDAWVLTNWETFGKNVVLFIAAVSVFKGGKQIIRFITAKMAWMVSMYTFFFRVCAFILLPRQSAHSGFPSLQDRKEYQRRHGNTRRSKTQCV